jgi:plasmid stabilization system protein ParE
MAINKVYWTPLAIKSLEESQAFILEHWDEEILDKYLDLIDARIEDLKINPEIAPIIGETSYRKMFIHKNISFFYTLEPEFIKLLLIWDNRQDPKKLKEKLTVANKR